MIFDVRVDYIQLIQRLKNISFIISLLFQDMTVIYLGIVNEV